MPGIVSRRSSVDYTGQLRYLPQNPIAEMCQVVFAPPLDVLRKSADVVVLKGKRKQLGAAAVNQSSSSQRNYKFWLCIYKARLHLFQYYGDAEPRFIYYCYNCIVVDS